MHFSACLPIRGLVLACVLAAGAAHATDIDCDPAKPPAGAAAATQLICESALFSMGHRRIHADQQRMLQAGTISDSDVAVFRKRRDACDTAACLDTLFREWNAKAAALRATPRSRPAH